MSTDHPPETSARRNKSRSALRLLALSLVYHVIFIGSIFDIYFQSPVVSVPTRYRVESESSSRGSNATGEGLAKRVVLIVGDGLRADKLFQTYPNPPFPDSDPLPKPLESLPHALVNSDDTSPAFRLSFSNSTTPAPFLRSLIQSGQAQWGISHTRVPTESRPGHVALIGGMYEDVSAVTRGWTTNPIPFDSVLNQSSHAFTFGSPDILPMFAQGAKEEGKVETWSYDEEAEDFSRDAVFLDLWVLDQLEQLFENASKDSTTKANLEGDGTVFFLHLLGLDTTGHSYRPHGAEYHRNIRVVDYVVRRTVELINEYYNDDGETAYVFTADHGMSSLGNHGDGHPDNTRTPLVVWGKGVRQRADWEEPAQHDEYSKDWGLKGVRRDVEQADVAPLMSTLAGLAIPANSAGRTPLEYLEATPSFRSRAAFANANQLLAEAEAKSELKRQHTLSFRPFSELVDSPTTLSPEAHRQRIKAAIQEGRYLEAEQDSRELMDIALRASNYFQKYDWLLLRSIVTLGYLGFMAYVSRHILAHHVDSTSTPSPLSNTPRSLFARMLSKVPLLACLATTGRFYLESAPLTYSLYTLFAAFFWYRTLSDLSPFTRVLQSTSISTSTILETIAYGLLTILSLEGIAYGYTDRRAFAVLTLATGWGWPRGRAKRIALTKEGGREMLLIWRGTMSVLAMFPLLPVEKGEDLRVISAGAVVLLLLGALAFKAIGRDPLRGSSRARTFIVAEMILTVVCTLVTCSSATSLQKKEGLPRLNQYLGWAILAVSSSLPFIHGRPAHQSPLTRLSIVLLSFGPAFVILSLSYETLFYASFSCALLSWLGIESTVNGHQREKVDEGQKGKAISEEDGKISLDSVRVSVFFLGFVHLGFFGVGNVASISSFYLEPVYRLMTIFAPFPMGALLLFKLLIPFIALSAVSSAINERVKLPRMGLFLVSSVLIESLTITFFFRVTDVGSWLEIGSSITNFIICSLLGLFTSGLLLVGEEVLKETSLDGGSGKIEKVE